MSWLHIDYGLWLVIIAVWLAAAPFAKKTVRRETFGMRGRYLGAAILVVVAAEIGLRVPALASRIVPDTAWAGVLSVVLTASTLFASYGTTQILWTLGLGLGGALGVGAWLALAHPEDRDAAHISHEEKLAWRMPPLAELAPATLSKLHFVWLGILRAYLVGAVILVAYKVTLIALHRG